MNKKFIFTFYYYYYLAFFNTKASNLEKKIFENLAKDFEINIVLDEKYLFMHNNIHFSFNSEFEFLFNLYKSVLKNFTLNDEIENILKNYCIKVGFYNTNIDELSKYLLESITIGKTFNEVMEEISL